MGELKGKVVKEVKGKWNILSSTKVQEKRVGS